MATAKKAGVSGVISAKFAEIKRLPTRTWIAIFKGTLAYCILIMLFFIDRVRAAWTYPITLSAAVVVVVAGQPGANIGQCMFGEVHDSFMGALTEASARVLQAQLVL